MKKLFRSLITIALCAPLLSGCDFFESLSSLPEETKDVQGIQLRDYASYVMYGEPYKFEGKAILVYADKTEKDVTELCSYSTIDTSKVGTQELKVKYETRKYIYSAIAKISVFKDMPKLESISASDYTTEVEKGATYTFDGVVSAKYENVQEPVVIKNSDCVFSSISTSSKGIQKLTISYTAAYMEKGVEKSVTKSTTANITVKSTLKSISASAIQVGVGRTKTIDVTCNPSDADSKEMTFSSDKPSIATVNATTGAVTGVSVGSAKITVTPKLTSVSPITVDVTVNEVTKDAWTLLMYVCGADLESDNGFATADFKEICSVNGQPDDVNIIIQTGGAKSWEDYYGIGSSFNERYYVRNKTLNKLDNAYTSYKVMGKADTLKDFITWGIGTYPADNIGLILWNHGGGLDGVCYDDKDIKKDPLTDDEVVTAVSGALSNLGMSGQKLEFICYDACLMQTMEIADFNSPYFKYQMASQETEVGEGYDYDTWIDDLYAKKSTPTILQAIADGFIADNGGVNGSEGQTQSFLDLSKVSEFKTAWENMGAQILSKIKSSDYDTDDFEDVIRNTFVFAEGEYALFDCYHFLENLDGSTFDPGDSYLNAAKNAITDVVRYNTVQKGAKDAHGLSFSFDTSYNISKYSSFSTWNSIVSTIGNVSLSGGGGGWWYF